MSSPRGGSVHPEQRGDRSGDCRPHGRYGCRGVHSLVRRGRGQGQLPRGDAPEVLSRGVSAAPARTAARVHHTAARREEAEGHLRTAQLRPHLREHRAARAHEALHAPRHRLRRPSSLPRAWLRPVRGGGAAPAGEGRGLRPRRAVVPCPVRALPGLASAPDGGACCWRFK